MRFGEDPWRAGRPTDPKAAKEGTKFSRGNFRCLMSGNAIDPSYIKSEAQAGRMGARLMAIVADGARERVYLTPSHEQEAVAKRAARGLDREKNVGDG